jgi:hypothetical protein
MGRQETYTSSSLIATRTDVDDAQFANLAAWIADAGLDGLSETALLTELCTRIVALGI